MGLSAYPCECGDGVTMPDELSVTCPGCGWHECSEPPIMVAEHRTCPECGHEW